jgi:enoyl-CoA hydratase/carnithine racemase
MLLTGENIGAEEALRIHLVHMAVSDQEVLPSAKEMAGAMAARGPISLRYIKEAVCKGMDMTLEQGLRMEADLYLHLHTTMDREEGIHAFREKRSPQFKGA